ncbi:hypothetical protein [Phenylobacterium sp.]|uniref:hypothetical protein n=1 Tax=Phenylobacterium sp. TaxID=1871053 RepID=UPI00374CD2C1
MSPIHDDLEAVALEELDLASALGWKQLSALTPWSDTFEGFTPRGREVCIARSYLWENTAGGDIRIEVTVYQRQAYEEGARIVRTIAQKTAS